MNRKIYGLVTNLAEKISSKRPFTCSVLKCGAIHLHYFEFIGCLVSEALNTLWQNMCWTCCSDNPIFLFWPATYLGSLLVQGVPNICLFGASCFARDLVLKNCLDGCRLKPTYYWINSKKCRWNTSTLPNSYFGIISPRYGEKRWWYFCVCLLYRRRWQCFIQVLKIWLRNLISKILEHWSLGVVFAAILKKVCFLAQCLSLYQDSQFETFYREIGQYTISFKLKPSYCQLTSLSQ